ncbi:MAG TPA: NifU family protein [Chloroflexia bacterium]|nr:NifU family protein [Chloroflexia bacterium]
MQPSSVPPISDPIEPVPEETLESVALRLDSLVQSFEQHPNEAVRQQVLEMLGLIDALHRDGIYRLVELIWTGSPAVLEKALHDPAVNMLLQLYDLAPGEPEPREQVDLALTQVRPYIESHGGAVDVLDVVEGVVHLRLSGACQGCAGSAMTLKRGIEAALREGFPGFERIEVHEPVDTAGRKVPTGFIPLQQVGPAARTLNRPVFTTVASLEALPPGSLMAVEAEGKRVLLCNVGGEIYAYGNECPGTDLPLDGGVLSDVVLVCPWHNCAFDARTGRRVDNGAGRLQVIPVAVREGQVQLALNVEPVALG